METKNFNAEETLLEVSAAVSEVTELMLTVDENNVNIVPYDGSWTAPQVLTHVTKSIVEMAKIMELDFAPANRNPGERIDELRKMFLDFSQKFQSPAFIMPEARVYDKQSTIDKLNESFRQFKENAKVADLDGLVEGLPLGPITKLEILYFTLFHTQRHIHQMKNICEVLNHAK